MSMLLTFSLAGFIWLILFLFSERPALSTSGIIWFIISGVLNVYFGRTFFYLSIEYLGAVRVATIKNLTPFITAIIAIIFLNEPLGTGLLIGGACIFFGLFLMVRQSFVKLTDRIYTNNEHAASLAHDHLPKKKFMRIKSVAGLGYLFAMISVLAYAFGNSIRKHGLSELPDPYLGALLGSAVGILIFLALSVIKEGYRSAIVDIFKNFNPWMFAAGIAQSFGQILYFAAINLIEVSRVSLIVGTETIVTILLSAWLFKIYEDINRVTIVASLIVVIGTMSIIILP